MPNFHDLPDGSSSVNHTGESYPSFEDIDILDDTFEPIPTSTSTSPPPIVNGTHNTAINPAWRTAPYPAHEPMPLPPRTATEMLREASERFITRTNEDRPARPLPIDTSPQVCDPNPPRRVNPRRRRGFNDPDAEVRKDPNAWSLREAVELCKLLEVVLPEAGFHIALTGGLLYKEGRRKDCDLMFYQIRQMEPNYEVLWKYLTVAGVLRSPSYPENGWLVKATYRGKVVDCLFPNAKKVKKVVGKEPAPNQNAYQTSPPTPPTPAPPTIREGYVINPAWEAASPFIDPRPYETINVGPPPTSAPVIPILYRRSPDAPGPYDPAELLSTPAPRPTRYDSTREATAHELEATEVYLRERRGLREPEIRSNAEIIDAALLATPAPAPIPQYPPVNLENGVTVRYDPATRSFRTERQAEAAVVAARVDACQTCAAPIPQEDIPF